MHMVEYYEYREKNRLLKCCFYGKRGVILRKLCGKLYFEGAKNKENSEIGYSFGQKFLNQSKIKRCCGRLPIR